MIKPGIAARDTAMARVEKHAPEEWKQAALKAVYDVAIRSNFLTSDDVRDELTEQGVPEPHEMRALGPIMMRAARMGIIQRAERVSRGRRAGHHADIAMVWASNVLGWKAR